MTSVKIGDREIGQGFPCYFVADIAANHDGDLKRAYKLIELAKDAGADAAKFQNFKAEKIVSDAGFSRLGDGLSHQANWGRSVFEIYKNASLPASWTELLKNKCDEVGIEYFTSPYDLESVDLVDKYVNAYKIGSGDVTWHRVVEKICSMGKPVIMATGACAMEDVCEAVDLVTRCGNPLVLMQCNTNYTGNIENLKYINLRVLEAYRKRFPATILGLSDHTPGDLTVLGAVALGAKVVEKHFTDDQRRDGPDHPFSMSPVDWREMVDHVRQLESALGDGVKRIEENESETAVLQRRGLRYRRSLKRGEVLTERDVIAVRPRLSDSLDPQQLRLIEGRRLRVDVERDSQIMLSDLRND